MMGTQALPAGLGAALTPRFNERMARGIQTTIQNGNVTGMGTNTPSLLTTIGQGLGTFGALGSMGMGAMSGMGGMGAGSGLGGLMTSGSGMGSGAAANQTFGTYGSWM